MGPTDMDIRLGDGFKHVLMDFACQVFVPGEAPSCILPLRCPLSGQ